MVWLTVVRSVVVVGINVVEVVDGDVVGIVVVVDIVEIVVGENVEIVVGLSVVDVVAEVVVVGNEVIVEVVGIDVVVASLVIIEVVVVVVISTHRHPPPSQYGYRQSSVTGHSTKFVVECSEFSSHCFGKHKSVVLQLLSSHLQPAI